MLPATTAARPRPKLNAIMPSKTTTLEVPASQAAKYAAAIDDCIARIDQALKQSKHEHEEIARLKKQSRARLARWKTQLP
jgi:hypothetical protein